MKLAFVITGAPYTTQAPQTAWYTAEAALEQGHQLIHVFLYGDGVHTASASLVAPEHGPDWPQRWSALLLEQGISGTACVGSALKRGVMDEREARRLQKPASNLRQGWSLAGLGEWVSLSAEADRVLYFNRPW